MARAYSLDVRERVVAAVLRGMSGRAVAVLSPKRRICFDLNLNRASGRYGACRGR
jgi:hypothetical protein